MNLAACGGLSLNPENRVWYRAVNLAHLATALSSAHTTTSRTRFNPGALLPAPQRFQILYLAEDRSPRPRVWRDARHCRDTSLAMSRSV